MAFIGSCALLAFGQTFPVAAKIDFASWKGFRFSSIAGRRNAVTPKRVRKLRANAFAADLLGLAARHLKSEMGKFSKNLQKQLLVPFHC
ncbi:hypothetical protein GGD81_001703 [Rhodobium orientis]|uniref:hypothetical protein n=1 Tax=Rhodobium orientis TaxID=34017 RepID=UPI0011B93BA0|nr:hypothetical protein [Rhodobium orientis]MBB4302667.1 hypothetical protein [Rhodobium orientis]